MRSSTFATKTGIAVEGVYYRKECKGGGSEGKVKRKGNGEGGGAERKCKGGQTSKAVTEKEVVRRAY